MKIILEGSWSEIRAEAREILGYGDTEVLATGNAMVEAAVAGQKVSEAIPGAVDMPTTDATPPKPAKKVRKSEAAPAAAAPVEAPQPPAAAPAPEQAPAPAVAVTPAYPPATLDEARAAVAALVDTKGVPIAKALLSRFGVARVQDALPERFGEIKSKALAAVAGTFDPNAA